MISILPLSRMSSDDKVAQLEAQLQKAKANRAAWKAAEKVVVEAKQVTEEKAGAEAKQVAKEKVAEAEACQIMEEKAMVAAVAVRRQAVLDAEARCQAEAEEAVAEPVRSLL